MNPLFGTTEVRNRIFISLVVSLNAIREKALESLQLIVPKAVNIIHASNPCLPSCCSSSCCFWVVVAAAEVAAVVVVVVMVVVVWPGALVFFCFYTVLDILLDD